MDNKPPSPSTVISRKQLVFKCFFGFFSPLHMMLERRAVVLGWMSCPHKGRGGEQEDEEGHSQTLGWVSAAREWHQTPLNRAAFLLGDQKLLLFLLRCLTTAAPPEELCGGDLGHPLTNLEPKGIQEGGWCGPDCVPAFSTG